MTTGFVSFRHPARGVETGWLQNGNIYVWPELSEGILGLIQSRRINDGSFINELDLRARRERPEFSFADLAAAAPGSSEAHIVLPFSPPEVWGAGVTYRKAADLHEEDIRAEGGTPGLYTYVFSSERPEIFFKAMGRHCVGYKEPFVIRGDSCGTMIEAELACIYDAGGKIVGYTIANDVTAWDIEKESPLFLSYAKTFMGCCALGPVVVPASLVENPSALPVECSIVRNGQAIYSGGGNTSFMKRTLLELSNYLCYCKEIPAGTVLCTGTAVGIPNDLAIEAGDRVTIEIASLGTLTNNARRWPALADRRFA